MTYSVSLDLFEGPLDLLLYLIRKEEIEITDIPIARITEQYLCHLATLRVLELDSAGEYLLLAATLLRIKSRILLPRPQDLEDETDPRQELVDQLLEYRKYKEIAAQMDSLSRDRDRMFDFNPAKVLDELRSHDEVFELGLVDLMGALRSVMETVAEREAAHHVELENVTLESKLALVREKLKASPRFLFRDFFARSPSRLHLVVTFMALLELMRLGEARVFQQGPFTEIWIEAVTPENAEVSARTAIA